MEWASRLRRRKVPAWITLHGPRSFHVGIPIDVQTQIEHTLQLPFSGKDVAVTNAWYELTAQVRVVANYCRT